MEPELKDRFEAAILGLAIGDALGWPVEFLSLAAIRAEYGPAGITDLIASGRHAPGTYTDDTQMSIAVAEALIEAGQKDLDDLMPVMAGKFVAWAKSPDNDRAPGNTCMAGCRNLAGGAPWRSSGIASSKGYGSAMRVAPIGFFYHRDEERLIEVARASAVLTHRHSTAVAAAGGAALLVAWAVLHEEPAEYPGRLAGIMRAMEGGAEIAALLVQIPDLLGREPEEVLCQGVLGESWVADEAVASALYCFLRTPHDYRATVLTAANTDGDSDSIACIAGGISGAFNGTAAIPPEWRERVENRDYLVTLAGRLLFASAP